MSNPFFFIGEYAAKVQEESTKGILVATQSARSSVTGSIQSSLLPKFTGPAFDKLASNPIVNVGGDLVSNAVTKLTQGLMQSALESVSRSDRVKQLVGGVVSGAELATDTCTTAIALASTADTEFVMQLARNTAKIIVKKINEKQAVIDEMRLEATKLINAMELLLGSRPFFSDYYTKLVVAYGKIRSSHANLLEIERGLAASISGASTNYQFPARRFDVAVQGLDQALDLILPDRGADIKEISSGNLLDVSGVREARDALAAALVIPAVSAKISSLFLKYSKLTLEINGLLSAYVGSLNSYIATYKRNTAADKATLYQISSAIDQLTPLVQDMDAMLFPTDGRQNSVSYSTKVTSAATLWGIRLGPIVEWLKRSVSSGTKSLDLTGESVRVYGESVSAIGRIGDIVVGTSTLKIAAGQEKVLDTLTSITSLLISANSVIATRKIPDDVRQRVRQVGDLLSASTQLNKKLISALSPFISTRNNLVDGAERVLGNITKMASGLGLDRVSDLLAKGDVVGLLSVNSNTATYVGAAAVGLRQLLKDVAASPTATDEQAAKIQEIHDEVSRAEAVKKVEAGRSATAVLSDFIANTQRKVARVAKMAKESLAVATSGAVVAVAESADKIIASTTESFELHKVETKLAGIVKAKIEGASS